MRTDIDQDPDPDELTRTLNSLLTSLNIPLTLHSPLSLSLSPPLILKIFESMLRTRLPISAETRRCASYAARVEVVKMCIGVLEDDVLGIGIGIGIDGDGGGDGDGDGGDDVGLGLELGEVDPRGLAEGREGDVLRVARVLGWVGERMGYVGVEAEVGGGSVYVARTRARTRAGDWTGNIRGDDGDGEGDGLGKDTRPDSPSLHSAVSTSHGSSLLVDSTRGFDDSVTTATTQFASEDNSLYTVHEDEDEDDFSILGPYPLSALHTDGRDPAKGDLEADDDIWDDLPSATNLTTSRRRRCEDVDSEDSTSDIDDSYCHCTSDLEGGSSSNITSSITPPIRRTGYLEIIDVEDELRAYESRRKKLNDRSESGAGAGARRSNLSDLRSARQLSVHDTPRRSGGIITRHTSPLQHTLALLDERARLLSQLAKLRNGHY